MASLFNFFTEDEIADILLSLEHQEKKWRAISIKPIQGYGKATEFAKKDEAKNKADRFSELQSKISENTY